MASSFEGKLGRQLLSDLLLDIALKKLTGVLSLSRAEVSKSIVFSSGDPINASSTVPSEHLDARSIVLSLFEWTEAEYRFEDSEPACPRVLNVSTGELVLEGARQAASNPAFVDMLASPGRCVTRSQTAANHLATSVSLNSTEGYIFSLINSPRRLSEIESLSGLADEQLRPAVCVLLALGMLSVVDETAGAQPSHLDSEDEVIRGITRKQRVFETASYYEILGVDRISTTEGIDKAYQQLEAMFSSYREDYAERPDVQRQLHELFGKIKKAHQTLRDSFKRRDYDRLLGASSIHSAVAAHPRDLGGEVRTRAHEPSRPVKQVPLPNRLKDNGPPIERGQPDVPVREAKMPARKPIPIPELQMPVAPRNSSNASIERGQWDGSRLTPQRPSGPLTRPPAVLSPEEVSRLKQAPNKDQQALHFYRQGRLRLERRELDAAAHLFREAVRLDGSQPHYHFYLGIVLTVQAHARHEHLHHEGCHVTCKRGGSLVSNPKVRYEAERHFLRAAEIDPANAQIPLKLGQLYKEAGLLKKAELYLKHALMLDSDNHIARHELDTLYGNPEETEAEEEFDVEVR